MKNFELRRDRFELFESFENPLINITYRLTVPDFRPFCKQVGYPPFHFFLYALFQALMKVENFRYRILNGEVIMIERLIPSYTVMNQHNVLNFTRFEHTGDLRLFLERSVAARDESSSAEKLLHSGTNCSLRDFLDYVFITSIPWLDFTSIEHPVKVHKSASIPAIAWGKFCGNADGTITMPFAVQAHHGFVDGFHIYQLGEVLGDQLRTLIKR